MIKTAVINPYDQRIVEEISLDSEQEAFGKLDVAQRTFLDNKNWLTKLKRRDILENFKKILQADRDRIIATAISEGGKPYKDTVVEFERALSGIDIAIFELFNCKGEVINMELNPSSMHKHAYTIKEPRGVVLAISAFNHPINLIIHQVVPCVATSCPVLIKPALKTPLTCKLLVDALHQAGLDQAYCQYLPIENDVCERLVSNSKIAFMSFIGSARVGWYLRSKLASGAHCSLEHGGIAPVIIDRGALWSEIIPPLIKSSYYHAGQVCVSTQRIYVHEDEQDAFIESFKTAALALTIGDPKDADTDVGPLISPSELMRIDSWVQDSLKSGAELVFGGQRVQKTCYEPTMLRNPQRNDMISNEEVFGPVVAVYSYKNLEAAIRDANNSKYCFQAAMFTKNIDHAFMAATTLMGRTVLINEHTAFRVDWMPFGGHRQSGLGVGGIGYSMKDLAIDKLLIFNFEQN